MPTVTVTLPATGQIEWTGPTPTILDGDGANLVDAIYEDLVQPTPDGAWGDNSDDSWVEFNVVPGGPEVQFACAAIPAPPTPLTASGVTEIRAMFRIAHSDISAVTPFVPMLFDSREASLTWTDYAQLMAVSTKTDTIPGTYPGPPVYANEPAVFPPNTGDPVDLIAAWIDLLNSGYAYAGFSYGEAGITAVSTCRVFSAVVEVIYDRPSKPPQLRKYPNPNIGPTRQWPRPRRGITGIR